MIFTKLFRITDSDSQGKKSNQKPGHGRPRPPAVPPRFVQLDKPVINIDVAELTTYVLGPRRFWFAGAQRGRLLGLSFAIVFFGKDDCALRTSLQGCYDDLKVFDFCSCRWTY